MDYLENVSVVSDKNLVDFRFPVQCVLRPNQDMRGYAGKIEGGTIHVGDEVIALPAGQTTKVKSILYDGQSQQYAFNPLSVVLTLEDEIDVSRGNMLVKKNNVPDQGRLLDTMVFWMDQEPLKEGKTYIIKHNTTSTRCVVNTIQYRFNIENLHREDSNNVRLNEIGKVQLQTTETLQFDSYKKNHNTGAFIIIDEMTSNTVGAGIIIGKTAGGKVERGVKRALKPSPVLWFTGLSGSGKSTLACSVAEKLRSMGTSVVVLDGDVVRETISSDLGFSSVDRAKNIDRVTQIARLIVANDVTVIVSFISPYNQMRQNAREILGNHYHEVYIDCPLGICEERDVKGLYKKVRSGEIMNFTGITDPFEKPTSPDLVIDTDTQSLEQCTGAIVEYLLGI